MKNKIYIAGKVSGEPIAECTMKFGTAQKEIEALGFEVVNPLELVGSFKTPWAVAMKICLKALIDCDGVVLLTDWQISNGAKIEHRLAYELEIPVFTFNKYGLNVLKKNLDGKK